MREQGQRRPRVIVGVDGSPAALEAIKFAAREAVLRDATLVAMMAVRMPDPAWIDPYAIREHPEDGYLERVEDKLRSILAAVDTAGADVEPVVSFDPAPAALVGASADAELLVVGSRGRGGFRGMVMGSVSLQCVLHAHCPVTVVRPEPRAAEMAAETAEETAAAAAPARPTLEYARQQTTPTFL